MAAKNKDELHWQQQAESKRAMEQGQARLNAIHAQRQAQR